MEKEKLNDHYPTRHLRVSPLLYSLILFFRTFILLCSLYILGLFIWRYVRYSKSGSTLAILILSAVSFGWSLLSLFTTLTCLGHSKIAGFNVLVDTVYVGVTVAIAVLLRDYAGTSCGGTGTQRRDCRLLRAAFGISVGLAALYVLTVVASLPLIAAFRRSRPYGPSPENGYTNSGYNRTPERRGYITPGLATSRVEPGYRNSAYTTHSSAIDTNVGKRDGTGDGRETGDTTGLLTVPPPAVGQDYGHRSGTRAAATNTYEPYRAPTPVGGRQKSGVVEMPKEREYGGTMQRGEYYRAS